MKTFEELSNADRTLLLQFPAYVCLLAASIDNKMDEEEKQVAIWLTHIKTFSSEPMLHGFYKAAELVFAQNIQTLDAQLPQTATDRREVIKAALVNIDMVLQKMRIDYSGALRRSMKSYKGHISKAHRNVLEYFIFPLPVDKISD